MKAYSVIAFAARVGHGRDKGRCGDRASRDDQLVVDRDGRRRGGRDRHGRRDKPAAPS